MLKVEIKSVIEAVVKDCMEDTGYDFTSLILILRKLAATLNTQVGIKLDGISPNDKNLLVDNKNFNATLDEVKQYFDNPHKFANAKNESIIEIQKEFLICICSFIKEYKAKLENNNNTEVNSTTHYNSENNNNVSSQNTNYNLSVSQNQKSPQNPYDELKNYVDDFKKIWQEMHSVVDEKIKNIEEQLYSYQNPKKRMALASQLSDIRKDKTQSDDEEKQEQKHYKYIIHMFNNYKNSYNKDNFSSETKNAILNNIHIYCKTFCKTTRIADFFKKFNANSSSKEFSGIPAQRLADYLYCGEENMSSQNKKHSETRYEELENYLRQCEKEEPKLTDFPSIHALRDKDHDYDAKNLLEKICSSEFNADKNISRYMDQFNQFEKNKNRNPTVLDSTLSKICNAMNQKNLAIATTNKFELYFYIKGRIKNKNQKPDEKTLNEIYDKYRNDLPGTQLFNEQTQEQKLPYYKPPISQQQNEEVNKFTKKYQELEKFLNFCEKTNSLLNALYRNLNLKIAADECRELIQKEIDTSEKNARYKNDDASRYITMQINRLKQQLGDIEPYYFIKEQLRLYTGYNGHNISDREKTAVLDKAYNCYKDYCEKTQRQDAEKMEGTVPLNNRIITISSSHPEDNSNSNNRLRY